jgi:hypothetical protein
MAIMKFNLKDKPYVLGQGLGEVVSVLPDNGGYVVEVPSRGQQHYTLEGKVGSSSDRRLFYHNPVLVDPPKNPKVWNLFRALSLQLYSKLSDMYLNGELPDEGPDD